jgi:putative tricarboxylic transport membrane protein
MLQTLVASWKMFFDVYVILSCAIGSCLGFIVGAIPGIGAAVGVALVIPIAMHFNPGVALTLFMGIYSGSEFGGCVSAILINVPGGSSAATTMDGFPMAQHGKAVTAVSISTVASAVGGIIGPVLLILALPFLAKFVLLFASPEFFLLGLLGVTCIAAVTKGSVLKGLIAGAFGLMLCSVGLSPTDAQLRFTFDSVYLFDGLGFLPAIIGLFGIGEMIKLIIGKEMGIAETFALLGSRWEGTVLTFKYWKTLIRSSLIGLFVGLVPGIGATTSSFIAWAVAKRSSPQGDTFGKGNPEGIVATESANNSVIGGALMPTLLFGIPGSATSAVILGGLMMLGLRPGQDMFQGSGLVLTEMLLLGLIVSAVFLNFIGLFVAPYLGKITLVRKEVLVPTVFVMASLGIYIIDFSMFNVILIVAFGLFGFFLTKYSYALFPLILGLILGKLIEVNFLRSLDLGDGSLWFLFGRPVCVVIMLVILLLFMSPFFGKAWAKIRPKTNAAR